MTAVVHQLADCLRFVGMRDRLRCPMCSAVGTYKPHGGWFDGDDVRKVRRWLCKWCGYYDGPEGIQQAYYSLKNLCWTLEKTTPDDSTPDFILLGSPAQKVWPWRG